MGKDCDYLVINNNNNWFFYCCYSGFKYALESMLIALITLCVLKNGV